VADPSGAASHPAVAAVLAVTPLPPGIDPQVIVDYEITATGPTNVYRQLFGPPAPIAARQAAAVLRWLVDRRSAWTDYTAWELDDLTDLADEIDPKEGDDVR